MSEITNETINILLDKIINEAKLDKNAKPNENRKKLYDYLINYKKYDYEYFEGILRNYEKNTKNKFKRNPKQEFIEPLITDKGICNGFSQVYKLLLEKINIFSKCVICMIKHEDKFVGHQLNLVYDEQSKTFSFDDVTFGIIKKTEEYFNYDNPEVTEELQGIMTINNDTRWIILKEDWINFLAQRKESPLKSPITEQIIEIKNMSDFEKYGIIIKKSIIENKITR